MKIETVAEANQLQNKIRLVDEIIDKLTVDISGNKHISEFNITIYHSHSNNDTFSIQYDSYGKIVTKTWLSPESIIILDYSAQQFYTAVLKLYEAEKEKLKKEFDNLKD